MKKHIKYIIFFTGIFCVLGVSVTIAQDRLPREYTNPDEVVTFDRSTSFIRALDVINQFAQEYAGKVIIDRTGTDGNLGISVPPMHWQDALGLILQTKYLELIEQPDFYEIVPARPAPGRQVQGTGVAALPDTALSTSSKEIRINAIFFEGNRRALQEIGVDWSTLTENVPGNVGDFVNGEGGGDGQLPSTGSGSDTGTGSDVNDGFNGPFVSVNSKGAQSVSQNVFNALVNFGEVFGSGISVQALFSAFEADNLGEILASPSVKVLEGRQGRIQVGQDFSIKQRDFAGNVTDQFFSVGTILDVTPRIIEDNDTTFIHLTVEAERSSAQPDPVSTVIQKQTANTQTLLLDGEATVMAGLYRTEASEVRRGVPILKDLPGWFFGLRYVFGYNSKDYQTRELVVLIQASIEDGIPERMNQERFADKFETLENERRRMQEDILRYHNSAKEVVPPKDAGIEEDSVTKKMQAEEKIDASAKMDKRDDQNNTRINAEIETREIPLDTSQRNDSNVPNAISNSDQSHSYYVVGGSFKDKVNAENFRYKLDREGYEAEILVNVEDGYYMVAYSGFENKDAAEQFLAQIKNGTNADAWVYDNY